MKFNTLQKKIDHARSLSHSYLPELPLADFPALIDAYSDSKAPCLAYIDADGHRTACSYDAFCSHVRDVARFMQKRSLEKGDRIAIMSQNHWHTVVHYYAAWLLGIVVVPVDLSESDERIASILDQGKVSLALVRSNAEERLAEILDQHAAPDSVTVVVCTDSIESCSADGTVLQLEAAALGDEPALLVYGQDAANPSGGVLLSQRNLLENARAMQQWQKMDKQTVVGTAEPLHQVSTIVDALIAPFFMGATTILWEHFVADHFLERLQQEQVHIASMRNNQLQKLTAIGEKEPQKSVPSLRHILCGGISHSADASRRLEERFGIRVVHGFGLPETSGYCCCMPLDLSEEEHKKYTTSYEIAGAGVDFAANEMAIHDAEGNALAEEERGEVVVRGVNVMAGYQHNKQANEEAFTNGWLRTGIEGFFVRDAIDRPIYFVAGRL